MGRMWKRACASQSMTACTRASGCLWDKPALAGASPVEVSGYPSLLHGKSALTWNPQWRFHSGRRVVVLSETSVWPVLLAVPSCQGP